MTGHFVFAYAHNKTINKASNKSTKVGAKNAKTAETFDAL